MAVHTPRHRERCHLMDLLHPIDSAVTRLAADAFGDVNSVIEVHEVGKLRHPLPSNWPTRGNALPNGCHRCARHPERRVTAHALLGRRQSGKFAAIDAGVTISTIDAQGPRVQPVIEWDGLVDRTSFTTRPGCADPEHGERGHSDRNGDQRNQRASRDSSRAWREECRHQLSKCESPAKPRRVEGCIDSAYIAPKAAGDRHVSFGREQFQ